MGNWLFFGGKKRLATKLMYLGVRGERGKDRGEGELEGEGVCGEMEGGRAYVGRGREGGCMWGEGGREGVCGEREGGERYWNII